MKFVLKIVLIIGTAYMVQPYSPWWVVVAIPFIVSCLIRTNWISSFFSAFFAIGGLWFYVAYSIDSETNSILTEKISSLFMLNDPLHLIIATALTGGLAAGLGSLTGHTFLKLFEKKKSRYY